MADLAQLTPAQRTILLNAAKAEQVRRDLERASRNKFYDFYPETGQLSRFAYAKHMEFFAAGDRFQERALVASNRSGKTTGCGFEMTCHITGIYPKWWTGRRQKKPGTYWVCGEDAKAMRESLQITLLGQPGNLGTGMIPADNISGKPTMRAGTPEAYDTLKVRFGKNTNQGNSRVVFKTYDQGRESFASAKVDGIWFDEEPPQDIYTEGMTRTMSTVPGEKNGFVICSFTPLKGVSEVVQMFLPGGKPPEGGITGGRYSVCMTWDDTPHLSEDAKRELLSAYPMHERDARTKGVPRMGSGLIYHTNEMEVVCEPREFPAWFKFVYGLDVGWSHPTAAVWGALDPESDILYIWSTHRVQHEQPIVHAAAIKARGAWIPGVIDPNSDSAGQRDGEKIFADYTGPSCGLKLIKADNAVQAGIAAVWQRESTGRLKYFRTLHDLLEERRMYRRDEAGKIVKAKDDLMDALRYMVISGINIASPKPSSLWGPDIRGSRFEAEYEPFAEAYNVVDMNRHRR